MPSVDLRMATGGFADALAQALRSCGFEVGGGGSCVSIVTASETMTKDQARGWAERVVGGENVLVCGGSGPLLGALHLSRHDLRVSGTANPAPGVRGFGDHRIRSETPAVTGVGYALLGIDGDCVLLGGPRGKGRIAYAGSAALPTRLLVEAVRWLSPAAKGGRGA